MSCGTFSRAMKIRKDHGHGKASRALLHAHRNPAGLYEAQVATTVHAWIREYHAHDGVQFVAIMTNDSKTLNRN